LFNKSEDNLRENLPEKVPNGIEDALTALGNGKGIDETVMKNLIDLRLAEYKNNPGDTLDWDKIFHELEKEDETL
jgi:hypothetical protein